MRFSIIAICIVCCSVGCKKKATCTSLQGTWILKEMFQGDISTLIPDTSVLCEKLVINADNTFISSSNKTHLVWNTGTFDCSKVFDADSLTFKKGSQYFFNRYVRR